MVLYCIVSYIYKFVFVLVCSGNSLTVRWKDQTEIERELASLGITQHGVVSR
jgi:hypothetical protein